MKSPIEQYAEVEAMKKVDVLAAMDRDRNAVLGHTDYHESDLVKSREARSIVAELIGAIRENREVCQTFAEDGMPSNYFKYEASERRLSDILERIA